MHRLESRSASAWRLLGCTARLLVAASLLAGVAPGSAAAEPATLEVHTDFPSGSGKVEQIDQEARLIRLTPSEHPDRGWVCWWFIRVTGIEPGETLTLDVGYAPWATPRRAAVSVDGRVWQQSEPGTPRGRRMVYRHQLDATEAYFAWGPPFTLADAQQLVEQAASRSDHARAFELCRTRQGHPVPALRITQPGLQEDQQPFGVWIQARQHAWESGSSWVCAGVVQWLVSEDPRAEQLRKRANITIVPIMDVDNVVLGAGGKQQKPQDHNRDWSNEPHWSSVAAAMELIKQQNAAGQLDVFIDLHNPGANAQHPFYYITPRSLLSGTARENLDHFLAASRLEINGPLTFIGETHQSGAEYDPLWKYIAKNWVSFNCADHVLSLTLETPWNTAHSTTDGYQTVGRQLGLAIERYLRASPRQTTQPSVAGGQE